MAIEQILEQQQRVRETAMGIKDMYEIGKTGTISQIEFGGRLHQFLPGPNLHNSGLLDVEMLAAKVSFARKAPLERPDDPLFHTEDVFGDLSINLGAPRGKIRFILLEFPHRVEYHVTDKVHRALEGEVLLLHHNENEVRVVAPRLFSV